MKVGIFSGSFNPIHQGHLMIANYIAEFGDLDEVWFLVSPQNPLKPKTDLADAHHRLRMMQLAIKGFTHLRASDFELHLPTPSYTIDTLRALSAAYPAHSFSLVIGADNWTLFPSWKNYQDIIRDYPLYIYERLNHPVTIPAELAGQVRLLDTPIVEISSTFVRQSLSQGKNIRAFLPESVWQYLRDHRLYI